MVEAVSNVVEAVSKVMERRMTVPRLPNDEDDGDDKTLRQRQDVAITTRRYDNDKT